jgi:hypothetical protein
MQGGF